MGDQLVGSGDILDRETHGDKLKLYRVPAQIEGWSMTPKTATDFLGIL